MRLSLRVRPLAPFTLTLATLAACDSEPEADAGRSEDAGGRRDAGELGSIVDIAVPSPDCSMLAAAATGAGLVDAFGSASPFTVFAPTNDAFAASGITARPRP